VARGFSAVAEGNNIHVVAVADDGSEGPHEIDFILDPTGRYTVVPEVYPVVTSTAFC
jgi:hypothetical protein